MKTGRCFNTKWVYEWPFSLLEKIRKLYSRSKMDWGCHLSEKKKRRWAKRQTETGWEREKWRIDKLQTVKGCTEQVVRQTKKEKEGERVHRDRKEEWSQPARVTVCSPESESVWVNITSKLICQSKSMIDSIESSNSSRACWPFLSGYRPQSHTHTCTHTKAYAQSHAGKYVAIMYRVSYLDTHTHYPHYPQLRFSLFWGSRSLTGP